MEAEPLSFDGIGGAAPVAVVEATEARPFVAGHLPDGTPLRLTAGILNDLAAIYADSFGRYLPQRADEWATMIWMASRPAKEHGAAWREGGPPLMSNYPAMRSAVSRWIDEAFRASEADYVRQLALNLWTYANETRVAVADRESKKKDIADPLPTTPTN